LAAVYAPRKERVGTAMVLASATGFGTLSILAKLGYSAGLGTQQMLAFRFVLAAIGMVALAAIASQNPLQLGRTRLLTLLSMGALFYSAQSLTYFLALRTLPASLVVLIAYIYPSLVVAAGWIFLRRKVKAMHGMALAASFLGLVLLVGGAHFQLSWALLLALASPVVYTGYILVGQRGDHNRGRDRLRHHRPRDQRADAASEPGRLGGCRRAGAAPDHARHHALPWRFTSGWRVSGCPAEHVGAGGDRDARRRDIGRPPVRGPGHRRAARAARRRRSAGRPAVET
jgi:uncharacterized membrane protein